MPSVAKLHLVLHFVKRISIWNLLHSFHQLTGFSRCLAVVIMHTALVSWLVSKIANFLSFKRTKFVRFDRSQNCSLYCCYILNSLSDFASNTIFIIILVTYCNITINEYMNHNICLKIMNIKSTFV